MDIKDFEKLMGIEEHSRKSATTSAKWGLLF